MVRLLHRGQFITDLKSGYCWIDADGDYLKRRGFTLLIADGMMASELLGNVGS